MAVDQSLETGEAILTTLHDSMLKIGYSVSTFHRRFDILVPALIHCTQFNSCHIAFQLSRIAIIKCTDFWKVLYDWNQEWRVHVRYQSMYFMVHVAVVTLLYKKQLSHAQLARFRTEY